MDERPSEPTDCKDAGVIPIIPGVYLFRNQRSVRRARFTIPTCRFPRSVIRKASISLNEDQCHKRILPLNPNILRRLRLRCCWCPLHIHPSYLCQHDRCRSPLAWVPTLLLSAHSSAAEQMCSDQDKYRRAAREKSKHGNCVIFRPSHRRMCGFFEVVKLDRILGLLVHNGLSRRTYLLTEKQISKKGFQLRFGGCHEDFEISRFPSGVVEAWLIRIRILIQI
jgi:hypothetical protein